MKTVELIAQLLFLLGGTMMVYILWGLSRKLLSSPLNKSMGKEAVSLEKDAYCNAEVQRILIRLKLELNASKVTLTRFHNGGCFANGLDMKKFTITHETSSEVIPPLMDKGVAMLNSRYGIAFETLASQHQYVVVDVEDCLDQNFKTDMKRFGFKACNLFLIKQVDGLDEGILTVNFSNTRLLTPQERDICTEQIPRILDLINLKENRFNR
jgi:hypothetical protein